MEYKYHFIIMACFLGLFSLTPGISLIVAGERNKIWNSNSNRTDCVISNTYIVETECPSIDVGGGGTGGGDKRRYDVNSCYMGIVTYNYLIMYYKNLTVGASGIDYPSVGNYIQNNCKIGTEVFCWYDVDNPNDMELSLKIGSGYVTTGEILIGAGIFGCFIWCIILLIYSKRKEYQQV